MKNLQNILPSEKTVPQSLDHKSATVQRPRNASNIRCLLSIKHFSNALALLDPLDPLSPQLWYQRGAMKRDSDPRREYVEGVTLPVAESVYDGPRKATILADLLHQRLRLAPISLQVLFPRDFKRVLARLEEFITCVIRKIRQTVGGLVRERVVVSFHENVHTHGVTVLKRLEDLVSSRWRVVP
uniref:Uncharacterized protein n=1 Tax=Timema bartmani TaxID=61472 RepID=A0A7R9F694_9NEOP|nr:unnamed protein product [Timema bartmani]